MKSRILLIVVAALFFLVLASYIYFGLTKQKTIPPAPQTTDVAEMAIFSIDPAPQNHLIPGKKQVFTINFNKPIDLSSIRANLRVEDLSQNKAPEPVTYTTTLTDDKKTLSLTLTSNTLPYSEYSLTVVDVTSKKTILNTTYLTEKPVPTTVPTNDPALTQFLPHDTTSYTLSYLEERNVYLFSFKYIPGSGDINTQYEKAREDALSFIKSKGVDPSGLAIEWK